MKGTLFFCLTLLLGAAVPGAAQTAVREGVVIDAKYRTPVPYAALYIQGTGIGTVAGSVGEFSFAIPDSLADRPLTVVREGFEPMLFSPKDAAEAPASGRVTVALQPDDFAARSQAIRESMKESRGRSGNALSGALKFVMNDWVALGNPETNLFDFGRLQTLPTYNPVEGFRLRAGLASNSRLSPYLFVRGYAAYGFGDRRLKYRGEAICSFTRKAYHEEEFPKNSLRLVYENDLYSPGESHPYALNDRLLITYRRSLNEAVYRNFAEINYEREYAGGFAYTLRLRRSNFAPQGTLQFDRLQDDGTVIPVAILKTAEAGILLRYSVREAYIQQKRKKIPLEITSPVFILSHSVGLSGFMGSETACHRTEFSVQKRFLLGRSGRLDVAGEAMKVWNSVPFPLLTYANQRHQRHIENSFFFLNRALEFMSDEQYTLRMAFVGDDLLLSKLPVTNMLRMRELISLRASCGRLSDRNNPSLRPEGLYRFPSVSHPYDGFTPYAEGTVGITNIFGLLRVEYVHRLTYRHHPDALLGAVRVDITL
ncbi:MAG: DUF5686 and carboxypeptidase regulatory-like domain-containing protein [Proteiniphilum sp.]|nr:DUF5686 and carboxypeptidase regulatory-like domain-containing protein [Proteiniphilum sp.]